MSGKPDYQKIGALWRNVSKRTDDEYLSGTISLPNGTALDITLFVNKHKGDGDNRPHYLIHAADYGVKSNDENKVSHEHPFQLTAEDTHDANNQGH